MSSNMSLILSWGRPQIGRSQGRIVGLQDRINAVLHVVELWQAEDLRSANCDIDGGTLGGVEESVGAGKNLRCIS